MSTATTTTPPKIDFDAIISRRIGSFSRRRQRLLVIRGVLAAMIVFVVAMLVIAACDYFWFLTEPMRWTLSLAGYSAAALAAWWYGFRGLSSADPRTLARQIESVDPRLREDLLSAVELAEPNVTNGSPVFLERLKRGVAKQVTTLDLSRLLPIGLLKHWMVVSSVLIGLVVLMSLLPSLQFPRRLARAMLPGVPIQRVTRTEIRIISPTPATRNVAQGDAVGVVVETNGVAVEDVFLQWYTDEGESGEATMTRREGETFAANLPIGAVPVDYRIRGGDCITLWERLTPQPRPRVNSFDIRYRFPEYAQLDDQVETTDHGDLRALLGTVADITVTFDQPVNDAVMRFDGGRFEMRLTPVEDDAGTGNGKVEYLRHHVEFPIRSPATYNIDSISRTSGLSNPFSPRYSVTPITDSPPVARWGDEILQSQLVAPLEKVKLNVNVQDDLPLDEVKQLFQLNSGKWQTRNLEIESPSTDLDLAWSWDLAEMVKLLPKNEAGETVSLVPGDVIRTRIIAQDRKLQSGESTVIEILVADEGFATDRHDSMREFAQFVTRLSTWLETAMPIAPLATSHDKQAPSGYFESLKKSVDPVLEPLPELRQQLGRFITKAPTSNDAAMLSQLGGALVEMDRRLSVLSGIATTMNAQESEVGDDESSASDAGNSDVAQWKDFVRVSKELETLVQQASQFATSLVGHEMTLAVASDSLSMLASIKPLVDPEESIADDLWTRHLSVLVERIRDVRRLVAEQQPALPQSTFQQLNNWSEWIYTWELRLELAAEEFPGQDNVRSQMKSFHDDLRDRVAYAILDGKVPNNLRESSSRFARSTVQRDGNLVDRLKQLGQEIEKSAKEAASQSDSKQASEQSRRNRETRVWFASESSGLVARLTNEEALQREHALADLRYAADLALARRAVTNVTNEGYSAYKEIPPEQVHREISQSIGRLECVHMLVESQRNLLSLEALQMRVYQDASSRFSHPLWLEQIQLTIEHAELAAQQSGLSWEVIEPFNKVRSDETAQRASQQMGERRYTKDPLVPVVLSLKSMSDRLDTAIKSLSPVTSEARQILSKYVLSLPEQAREAAKLAEAAEKAIQERPDSSPPSEEEVRDPHAKAEQATRDTIRALVDLANTLDMSDASDRELARDADVAAAQINESSREAKDAMEMAKAAMSDAERATALEKAAESLGEMKEQLAKTAEHFEDALAGNDVSESRDELRALEEALGMDEMLDQRYEDAAKMAERTESDSAELLKALEQELKRNEPMQESLDEIADQAADAAQRLLSRAAKEETSMRTSLERSDSAFDEQKQRLRADLKGLAREVSSLDRTLMHAAERSLGWNKPREETDEIREARENLTKAATRADQAPQDAPLEDMKKRANELAAAVDAAQKWTEKLKEREGEKVEEQVFDNDSKRDSAKRSLQQIDREARDSRAKEAKYQLTFWEQTKNDIGKRIQDAQRQERDANNRAQQHESRLKKVPDNESLKQEIKNEQQRAERARLAAEQGQISKDLAEQRREEVRQRQDAISKVQLADLSNVANPAAELTTKLGGEATEELANLRDDLKQLAERADIDDSLAARPEELKQLGDRHSRVNEEVELAAELLSRAARHQERLGNPEEAEQLDRAASQVGKIAQGSLEEAAKSLASAQQGTEQSSQASGNMARANADLAEQAQQLADLIQAQADNDESTSMQDESGTAEKLAQTLDELDQAVNGKPPANQSKQQSGPNDPSKSGEQSQSGQGKKAGEASKTLSDAAQSQAQRAAKQRSAQTSPEPAGEGEGEPSDEPGKDGKPGTQSGNGTMPRGADMVNEGADRIGDNWGALRERRTDDAVEDLSEPIAPGYRREIEAYFRAIAEQGAADKGAAEKGAKQ